jgi:CheY-like chemotaxis protein
MNNNSINSTSLSKSGQDKKNRIACHCLFHYKSIWASDRHFPRMTSDCLADSRQSPGRNSSSGPGGLARDNESISGTKVRILVLDDDELVRNLVKDSLEFFGYEVAIATEGGEAIEIYQCAMNEGKPFQVVILDLIIHGGMGGVDTLRKLQDIDPDVQAVASSGYADDPIIKDYRSHGFTGAIAKPYNIADLREVIARLIKTEPEQ